MLGFDWLCCPDEVIVEPVGCTGSSGYALVSGDDGTPPPEGLNCLFILLDEWELNKHCSYLSNQRLAKLRSDF